MYGGTDARLQQTMQTPFNNQAPSADFYLIVCFTTNHCLRLRLNVRAHHLLYCFQDLTKLWVVPLSTSIWLPSYTVSQSCFGSSLVPNASLSISILLLRSPDHLRSQQRASLRGIFTAVQLFAFFGWNSAKRCRAGPRDRTKASHALVQVLQLAITTSASKAYVAKDHRMSWSSN